MIADRVRRLGLGRRSRRVVGGEIRAQRCAQCDDYSPHKMTIDSLPDGYHPRLTDHQIGSIERKAFALPATIGKRLFRVGDPRSTAMSTGHIKHLIGAEGIESVRARTV